MRKIPIVTPQNVMIELEGAGVFLRSIAFIVDVIIKILLTLILVFFIEWINVGSAISMALVYFIIFPSIFLYTMLFELFMHGQTPGKMLVGIAVRRLDGSEAGPTEILTRWFMRVIDIYVSIGAMAALFVSATEREQRLGDMLSGTTVVKKRASSSVRLEAIEELQNTEDYKAQFPQVVHLKEEDVLLMKNTIVRYERYQNQAHSEALNELVQHLKKILGLKDIPRNQSGFVRTLIKDYIMLTRLYWIFSFL